MLIVIIFSLLIHPLHHCRYQLPPLSFRPFLRVLASLRFPIDHNYLICLTLFLYNINYKETFGDQEINLIYA